MDACCLSHANQHALRGSHHRMASPCSTLQTFQLRVRIVSRGPIAESTVNAPYHNRTREHVGQEPGGEIDVFGCLPPHDQLPEAGCCFGHVGRRVELHHHPTLTCMCHHPTPLALGIFLTDALPQLGSAWLSPKRQSSGRQPKHPAVRPRMLTDGT